MVGCLNFRSCSQRRFVGAQKITSVPRLGIMKSQLLNNMHHLNMCKFQGVGNDLDNLVQWQYIREIITS